MAKASKKGSHKTKTKHEHKKDEHHAHKTEEHHAHKKPVQKRAKKKTPVLKYAIRVVIFVVLVALAYLLITKFADMGTSTTGGPIAAVVNGEPITTAYLDEQYSRIPAEYRPFLDKKTLLNQTINEVVLLQEAKKQGITVSDEKVREEIDLAMLRGGITPEDLDERLAEQNMTIDVLTELYQKQLMINELLDKELFSDVSVSEEDILAYYDSRIHAMHILVATREEAQEMISELKGVSRNELAETFGDLASEYSTDPSAQMNRGDLGEFGRGQMVAPFEEAAFALDEFEYSDTPVQTSFGFHVILRLPKEKSLEDSYDEIQQTLSVSMKAQMVPAYIQELKDKSDIEVFYT